MSAETKLIRNCFNLQSCDSDDVPCVRSFFEIILRKDKLSSSRHFAIELEEPTVWVFARDRRP